MFIIVNIQIQKDVASKEEFNFTALPLTGQNNNNTTTMTSTTDNNNSVVTTTKTTRDTFLWHEKAFIVLLSYAS